MEIMEDLKKRIEYFKQKFNNTSDFASREISTKNGTKIAIIYIENIIDKALLSGSVILTLQNIEVSQKQNIYDLAKSQIIAYTKVSEPADEETMLENILNGFCAILFENTEKVLVSGDLKLDLEGRRVFIADKEINLTAKEFDLLELLAKNPNKVYSRENLLNLVWGYEYPGDVRTVDVHIRRLREKIEINPSEPKFVHTKWGVGYYFQG